MLQSDVLKTDEDCNKECVSKNGLSSDSGFPESDHNETKFAPEAAASDDGSWPCPRCTYLNYSKSSRCSMCNCQLAPEDDNLGNTLSSHEPVLIDEQPERNELESRNDSPLPSSSAALNNFQSLIEKDTTVSREQHNHSDSIACKSYDKEEAHNTELIESVANFADSKGICSSASDENEANQVPHIILSSNQKWSCPRCTFYNWPKSKVCVVCRAPPNWTSKKRNPSDGNNSDSFSKSRSPEIVSSDDGSGGSTISLSDTNSKQAKKGLKQKWHCICCSNENSWKSQKCAACGKKKVLSIPDEQLGRDVQKQSPPVTVNRKSGNKANSSRSREAVFTIEERMKRLNIRKKSPVDSKRKGFSGTAMDQSAKDICAFSYQKYFQSNNRFSISKLDWMFLQACWAVSAGAIEPVEAYIIAGGDKKRILTSCEANILDLPGVVERFNLMMIALLFKRTRIIEMLMSQEKLSSFSAPSKYPACVVSADLTNNILRTIANNFATKSAGFRCYFLQDNVQTYGLPAEIHNLPRIIQKQLMNEIVDQSVKRELEIENSVINWNREVAVKLKSKLRPLWNRTAGDCLLDAVLQATWGVFDTQNLLRKALADNLKATPVPPSVMTASQSNSSSMAHQNSLPSAGAMATNMTHNMENFPSQFQNSRSLYQRWREQEMRNAADAGFSLDAKQLEEEWHTLVRIAAQPGQPLEQLHIFVLAHILRRPIIVYGVKMVKSFRGEEISPAKFEGVYLPLLWEPSFCNRNPICLSYTPGHFSALVTLESSNDAQCHVCGSSGTITNDSNSPQHRCANGTPSHPHSHPHPAQPPQKFESPNYYLPLVDSDFAQLPVHFLLNSEAGQEDILLNQMLDCIVTPGGILVARFLANCSNGGIGGGVGGGGGAATNPPTHTSCTPPLAHPAPPSTTHPLVQTMNNLWLDRYRVLASTMNQSEDESGDELIDDNRRSRALLTTTIQ
ncbi:ubiquitin thioesterase zranb1-B-like [Symsagittifera roscoffensis]|uniref:ubiquitin thioesterase zranb1-B-like n=1 Tax=Symsagittifera roscoffensis TaxID=84072 RepID=UPI00307B3000